jgi:AraC family transcriptional regulator
LITHDFAIPQGDPVAAVRLRLVDADDQLRAGDWAEAEQTLRAALAGIDDARDRDGASIRVRGGLTPNQQRRLIRYIDERLGEAITLSDLARVARLSASHFCHMFRSSFGLPPLHYVQRRRAERAMAMMLTTDQPLAAIAVDCGLYDQAALCKVFRRFTGQTPAAWRRQRRS